MTSQTFTSRDVRVYNLAVTRDPCAYCGGPAGKRDHIEPRFVGGPGDWSNRTAACDACNGAKGSLSLLAFLGSRRFKATASAPADPREQADDIVRAGGRGRLLDLWREQSNRAWRAVGA